MFINEYPSITKLTTREELTFDPLENAKKSPYVAANPYGDWVGMSAALRLLCEKFKDDDTIKILEMGTAHGQFVYSMKRFVEGPMKKKVTAIGMDSMLHGYAPRFFDDDNITFFKGNSTDPEALASLDDDFHFIFIDACHCQNHAFMDAGNFHSKLRKGGFLGFHDTHPTFQGGSEQPRTPECSEDTHIGVVKGIAQFDPGKHNLEFLLEEEPLDKPFGGFRIYEKV